MRRFNRWLLAAPLPFHFLVMAVVYAAGLYGEQRLTDSHASFATDAIGGVVFGAVMTALFAWRRRKDGGASQQLAFVTAVKSGELPADADPEVWGPLLDRKQRTFRRWQPWVVVEFLAFTALAVVLAVGQGAIWWAFAAFFLGMGVWLVVVGRRNARRLDGLRAQLAQKQRHLA